MFRLAFLLLEWSFMLQEAQAYAQENGLFFLETSAKAATNVNDIFYEIGTHLYTSKHFKHLLIGKKEKNLCYVTIL